ncbi:MAG: hypothetical protein J2P15_04730 [Micromonosporaceae bacterium]|nr:hypothetical protein [Micromonosporaceae bacterium]
MHRHPTWGVATVESVVELARQPLWVAGAMTVGGAIVLLMALMIAMRVWGGPSVRAPRGERVAPAEPGAHRPGVRGGDIAALYREAQRLTAYAVAARERANVAREAAAAARQRQAAAETIREDAWNVYSTSESPVVVAAGADGPATPPKELTHAAFVAFREGAITVEQLQQVWSGTEPADPSTREQRRAATEHAVKQREARREFERAVAEERTATEQVRVAEVAAEALTTEADEAEQDALAARDLAQRYRPLAGGVGGAGTGNQGRAGRGRPGRGAT